MAKNVANLHVLQGKWQVKSATEREREEGESRWGGGGMRVVAVTVAFYEIINMYAPNGLKSAMAH